VAKSATPVKVSVPAKTNKSPFGEPDKTLYLIDISSFIFRAFFAIRSLKNKRGEPTNALFGVANMLAKLAEEANPKYLTCVFDSKEPSFRSEMYEDYKANRSEPPEDLIPQFALIEQLIHHFEIHPTRLSGVEADDLIATLDSEWKKISPDHRVIVVSSDKDLMQLVDDRTLLWDTMNQKFYREPEVIEKFAVRPDQIRDYLAMVGDSSDNIPGIPGIGPKSASDLLKEFETMEGVYKAAESGKITGKKLSNILDNREVALLSQKLTTVKKDCKVPCNKLDFEYHFHLNAACVQFFKDMDFHSLLQKWEKWVSKDSQVGAQSEQGNPVAVSESVTLSEASSFRSADLGKAPSKAPSAESSPYRTINEPAQFRALLADLSRVPEFALDLETTSLNPRAAQIVGIALSYNKEFGVYIPVGHAPLIGQNIPQLPLVEVLEGLRPLLKDPRIKKIGQNLKYDMEVLACNGVEVDGVGADTMVASYNLDPNGRHNLDFLARKYLDEEVITYEQVCGKGKDQITFDQVPIPQATRYSAEDAWVTLRLWHRLNKSLQEQGLMRVFAEIDLPLVQILTRMELQGVALDVPYLRKLSQEFSREIQELEKKVFAFTDGPINLNSPKQLGHLLFEQLKLPTQSKTKTGYSTDASVLEALENMHEVPRLLLEYREITKLKGTYVDPLPEMVDPRTGKIHTSYHQAGTVTGRLSSSDPNLQNIPIRSERGMRIRKAFIASPGNCLVSADYSQIELRLLAHMSDDPELVRSFNAEEDVHRRTASEMFGIPLEKVDDRLRSFAKAINFGLMYGKTAFGLAAEMKISRSEAAQMIEKYFIKYAGVKRFLDGQIALARSRGYVTTLAGRKRELLDIRSANPAIRNNAERMAMNSPIQGTAADLMKLGMIELDEFLRKSNLKSKMILQVHDEVVLDCPRAELDAVEAVLRDALEVRVQKHLPLNVPLKINVSRGETWADL